MSAWGNWRDINYVVFEIKHKLCIASDSAPSPKEKFWVSLWGMSNFVWRCIINVTLHCIGGIVPKSTITFMSQCKTLLHVTVAYIESV